MTREREPRSELRHSFLLRTAAAAGGLLSTFVTTVVAVRALSPADAATFLGILAALMLGPMIGRFGLGQNVLRTLAAEPDPALRRRQAGVHLRIALVFASLTAPLVALAATASQLGAPGFLLVTVLTAALIVLETARLMLSDVFAATSDVVGSVATTHHVRSIVVLPGLLAVAFLVDRPTLVQMVVAYLLGGALPVLLVAAAAWRAVDVLAKPPRGAIRAALVAGTALFCVDGALFVVGRGDVWLAASLFDPVEAAHYSTASTLAFQVMVLDGLASLAVTPIAARMWAQGRRSDLLRLLSAMATLSTAATLLAIGVLVLAGRWVLDVAYGPGFADAFWLLVILALGGLGRSVLGLNITLLIVMGQLRRAAWAAVLTLVLVVPAAIAAAVYRGPTGLAVAATVAAVALPVGQWLATAGVLPADTGERRPRPSWNVAQAWREVRRGREAGGVPPAAVPPGAAPPAGAAVPPTAHPATAPDAS